MEPEETHDTRPGITPEILNLYLYGKRDDTNRVIQTPVPNGIFMPPQIRIQPSSIPGADLGVFATTWLRPGTLFGPVEGREVAPYTPLAPHEEPFSWEVWSEDGDLSHHVVVDHASWTAHVTCARHDFEQNVMLRQRDNRLFYEATKLLRPGDELLVWYAPTYSLYMGIPETLQPGTRKILTKDKAATIKTPEQTPKSKCVICSRAFNSRSNLRSHMRIHTMEKPFNCPHCQRSFSQSSTLRNHMRLHTGEKPYTCISCDSSYSQLAGLRAHQKSARHRMPQSTSTTAAKHEDVMMQAHAPHNVTL